MEAAHVALFHWHLCFSVIHIKNNIPKQIQLVYSLILCGKDVLALGVQWR